MNSVTIESNYGLYWIARPVALPAREHVEVASYKFQMVVSWCAGPRYARYVTQAMFNLVRSNVTKARPEINLDRVTKAQITAAVADGAAPSPDKTRKVPQRHLKFPARRRTSSNTCWTRANNIDQATLPRTTMTTVRPIEATAACAQSA